jgi:hypothetical protein
VEYAKQIATRGAIAIIAVLFLASLALYAPFGVNPTTPSASSLQTTSQSSSVSNQPGKTFTLTTTTTHLLTHTDVLPAGPSTTTVTIIGSTTSANGSLPALLLGIVYSQNVTCSLATGACTMKIVNIGKTPSFDVVAVGCEQLVISSHNNTTTVWSDVQGTVNGQILGIPAGAKINATCTIPTSQLSLQPVGSSSSGLLVVELLHTLYPYPPGALAYIRCDGTWT